MDYMFYLGGMFVVFLAVGGVKNWLSVFTLSEPKDDKNEKT